MAYNYSITGNGETITAAQIIAGLDPADPIQNARICEVWTLCKRGMSYSGEDGDVLGAAYRALVIGPQPVAEHERAWVQRWRNCPGYTADAIRWARSLTVAA